MKAGLFEGPFSAKLQGWRHYMLLTGNKRATFLALPCNGWRMAERLTADYFREGTWEAVSTATSATLAGAGQFAPVSPALLAQLAKAA